MIEPEEAADPADAERIVSLRGERPRVVRLSRKAIGIASAGGLALVGAALLYALQPPAGDRPDELYNTDSVAIAEGLSAAPKDYSQVPRLGPPLPGDLGKPILDAQDRGALAELPPIGAAPPPPQPQTVDPREAARQRLRQEREAALVSRLFSAGTAGTNEPGATASLPASGDIPKPAARSDGETASADFQTVSTARLAGHATGAVLQAGSIIPAALITGIRSDQPGLVTAQVTENVYDSPSGLRLLIPQGSRLIGDYGSDVGFGQRRILLTWNRLILPDGRSILLDRQPAADPSGYAGLEDGVDYHWGGVVKAALISTLLGVGGELGSGSDGNLVRAIRRGGQDSVARAGDQVVSRELGVRPTLTIRPGFPVRVMVTRDLVFEQQR